MHEAFEASSQFLGTWAAGTGLLLTVLALGLPAWRAFVLVGRVLYVAWLQLRPRPEGRDLPGGLGDVGDVHGPEPLRELVFSARRLWTQIAHERSRKASWFDGELPRALAFWVGDAAQRFTSATELRAEAWRWLSQAIEVERGLPADAAELVADTERRLRALALGEGELGARVDAMLAVLAGFEMGVRQLDNRGYRAPPVPGPAGLDAEPSQGHEARRDAHARLLHSFEPDIQRVARRYANDAATRDDLAQEIRLALWVALPKHRGDASARTYVLRIAHYCGAKFARRQPRWRPEIECIDASKDLFDALACADQRRRLHAAVEALPSHERRALELLLSGLSYKEIARRLEISEGSASVRVSRARKRLRHRLAPVLTSA